MAWNKGLDVSIPLSSSSGDGFRSPSSHSHCSNKHVNDYCVLGTQRERERERDRARARERERTRERERESEQWQDERNYDRKNA